MAKKFFRDITTGKNTSFEEGQVPQNTNLVPISQSQFEKEKTPTPTPKPDEPTPTPLATTIPSPDVKKTASNGFGSGVGVSQADRLRREIFESSQKEESFEDIKARTTKQFQSEIDATNQIFDELVGRAERAGAERLRGSLGSTRAIGAARGILGTPRGAAQKTRVTRLEEGKTQSEIDLIQAERNQQISSLLGNVRTAVDDELKARAEAKKAGAKDFLEFLDTEDERKQSVASSLISSFVAQGISLEELSEDEKDRVASDLGVSRGDFEVLFRGQEAEAETVEEDEGFTLSPGQTRFTSSGEAVATGGVENLSDIDKANLELTKGKITAQNIKNEKDQASLDAVDNGELNEDQRKEALTLSKAVTGNASYKDMLDIQTGMLGVITGINQDNGFGDIAAINAFQRMVDPGATVRSEDVTLLQSAAAFIAKTAPPFVIDKLKKGDKLPPSVREQMKKTALELYDTRRNNYESSISPQRNLSEQAGIDFGKFVATEFKTADQLQQGDETGGIPDISSKINEAIENGFNPTEILDFTGSQDETTNSQINEARDNGFSDEEIIEFMQSGKTNVGGDTNQAVDPKTSAKNLKSFKVGNRNVKVSNQIEDRLKQADQEFFEATGKHIAVNQSFRTRETQQKLFDKLSKKGARVAPPGTSFHEKGLAVDVTNWKEAEPFLRKFGFMNDLADDKGHFSIGEFS